MIFSNQLPRQSPCTKRLISGSLTALVLVSIFVLYQQLFFVDTVSAVETSNRYIGSKACANCHFEIYNEYTQTSMGRSISEVTPALIKTLHLPGSYDDAKRNRHFSVYTQDGRLYQDESERDTAGNDVFHDTHPLQWMIGAGENGFGLLTNRENYLFQAPLSFYSKPANWSYSPGYEFADYGFSRPILEGCIVCHGGSPRSVPATNGRYEDPPFFEAPIGCEKCHGPGAMHVNAMKSHAARAADDTFIVNPAHLSAVLSDNICMFCHQSGDVRVLQPGRQYADFHPGMPLNDVLTILKVQPTRESPPDDDHVEHYYSMTLSKCYRASSGRLRCISCHDPHVEPSHEQAPNYFNQKCLTCHTAQSCSLPLTKRQNSLPADNCIGCHMPRRAIQSISHSSATNHRIVRRPGEPFPDITFQPALPSLSGLIQLDASPGKESVPPSPLTMLQAYGELAESKTEYIQPYLKILDELSRSQPENSLVQAALGRKELKAGNIAAAEKHLRSSLQLNPMQPAVAGDMADALEKLGRSEEAADFLRKAIVQDPFNPILRKKLIVNYISLRQYPLAKAALKQYLNYFPQDSFMRQMLARVEKAP